MERAGPGLDCYEATLLEPTMLHNQQALVLCDKAVAAAESGYNHAATLSNRADIRLRLKDFQGAVADSDQAIAIDPDMATAYLNRGAGLVGLMRYEEAVPALDKAIALGASRPQLAYFNRAIAKEALGDLTSAYHDYKSASELDRTFVQASEQLARFRVVTR